MQVQVAAGAVDLAEKTDQVLERAAQAIDRPCCDHVDLAPGNGFHQVIESGPLLSAVGAGNPLVREFLDDFPAMLLGNGLELATLVLDSLARGAHPQIE